MDNAGAAVFAMGVLAVGDPGDCRRNCTRDPERDCSVRPCFGTDGIEDHSSGPCTDWDISEHGMEGMSKPGAVERVLDLLASRPASLVSLVNGCLDGLLDRVQPVLLLNDGDRICGHVPMLPSPANP